jgi:hypothetical protein
VQVTLLYSLSSVGHLTTGRAARQLLIVTSRLN